MAILSTKHAKLLTLIVQEYLQTQAPVGSLGLSDPLGVSSATVRNMMVVLGRQGWLTTPHRSAGRVPTPQAIQWYVNQVQKNTRRLGQETIIAQGVLAQACQEGAGAICQAMADACRGAGLLFACQPRKRARLDVRGHRHLLSYVQDMRHLQAVQDTLTALEQPEYMNHVFAQVLQTPWVQLLCHDPWQASTAFLHQGYALIAAPYRTSVFSGVVGVVGPAYMDYPKIIPIIKTMATLVERTYDEQFFTDAS